MTILLSTLNARFTHASLGLRYLQANMGPLKDQTRLQEFVIGTRTTDIIERMLQFKPRIIGLGVYIWNVEETTKLVATLKRVAPEITIVLGGPEVSYEPDQQAIVKQADYLVTGWGDITFPQLCQQILNGPKPLMKIHAGVQPPLSDIALPYSLYSVEDIAHRTLYVEASRGCPFKCEFCLSSLDKTAWPFNLDTFIAEMEGLYQRGARLFKFVDRTFNLNIKTSMRIMEFFLSKLEANPDDPVYAHFELVPDHLPDALKETIRRFPPGALQFEIGIQTFNPEVQTLVSRRQDNDKAAANIRWLVEESNAHIWTASPAASTPWWHCTRTRSSSASSSACAAPPSSAIPKPTAWSTIRTRPIPSWPTATSTSPPCSAWSAFPATGTWWPTPGDLSTRCARSSATARLPISWPSPIGCTARPTPRTGSHWTGWRAWSTNGCKGKA
jgi:hypothetical protein